MEKEKNSSYHLCSRPASRRAKEHPPLMLRLCIYRYTFILKCLLHYGPAVKELFFRVRLEPLFCAVKNWYGFLKRVLFVRKQSV